MTLIELYNLTNFIIKDKSKGSTLTPGKFEDLFNRRQLDFFQEQYALFEATTSITDILRIFKTIIDQDDVTVISDSYFALPSNYAHFSTISYIDSDGKYYPFDMVTKSQAIMRKSSTLTLPTTTYPICYEFNNNLYIEPYDDTLDFIFNYLRYPVDVALDYYIDTNGLLVYLEADEGKDWDTGDTESDGTIHTAESFSVSASYQYASLTVEPEWEEKDQLKILEYILRDVGVSINEEGVYQYASISKNES